MPAKPRSYDRVVELFNSKKCQLYTTKDEYECMVAPSYQRVRFRASCGCDNDAVLDGFIFKNTGVICKQCTLLKVKKDLETYQSDNNFPCYHTEYAGIQLLLKYLDPEFTIRSTSEGCLADLIIRPKYESQNKWMMIQIKATNKVYKKDGYKFGFKGNFYNNNLIVCIAVEDEKFWVMDYTLVSYKEGICIGLTAKSYWYKYAVAVENLSDVFHHKYCCFQRYTAEYCDIPQSSNQIVEYEHKLLREKHLSTLKFEYPLIRNSSTDFLINGYKIQEKVAYPRLDSNKKHTACLKKCRQKVDVCYDKGDNDFYWIWIKNTHIFYIVPEQALINNRCIQVDGNINNKLKMLSISPNCWLKEYKYNLDETHILQTLTNVFKDS